MLYHGTTLENGEKIIKSKYFKISRTYSKKNKKTNEVINTFTTLLSNKHTLKYAQSKNKNLKER